MREEGVKKFLEALGQDRVGMFPERGWINTRCPLAPYTHAGGADIRPSFGVHINDSGPSVYWCFGCSPKGNHLGRLIHNLWIADGRYPYEAARIYAMEEFFGLHADDENIPLPDRWIIKPHKQAEQLPIKVLKKYPLLQRGDDYQSRRIKQWLTSDRGVPEWVQNMCQLRYHYDGQSVIFPMTDTRGRIFVLRERQWKEKSMWTVSPRLAGFPEMEFPKLRDVGAWFGMELIDWSKPVMLVEGEIDAMRLMALGFLNTIASCTSSVSDAQIDALTPHTLLILGFDADKGGNFAMNRVYDRLKSKQVPMAVADWSVVRKPCSESDCKDPGDLPDKDALSVVLENLDEL